MTRRHLAGAVVLVLLTIVFGWVAIPCAMVGYYFGVWVMRVPFVELYAAFQSISATNAQLLDLLNEINQRAEHVELEIAGHRVVTDEARETLERLMRERPQG